MNGKSLARRLPHKREPGSTSEKQLAHMNRFAAVAHYARSSKQTVIEPIWNMPAKQKNMSGYNLFLQANLPAFDASGQVKDPLLLRFSAGSLPQANNLTATLDPENPHIVAISWTTEGQGEASPYHDDCLMCVTYPKETIELVNTGFTRKDKKVFLEWPLGQAKDVFLFLFFWNKSRNSYSPDQGFKIQ
jgi:hypothetical protein